MAEVDDHGGASFAQLTRFTFVHVVRRETRRFVQSVERVDSEHLCCGLCLAAYDRGSSHRVAAPLTQVGDDGGQGAALGQKIVHDEDSSAGDEALESELLVEHDLLADSFGVLGLCPGDAPGVSLVARGDSRVLGEAPSSGLGTENQVDLAEERLHQVTTEHGHRCRMTQEDPQVEVAAGVRSARELEVSSSDHGCGAVQQSLDAIHGGSSSGRRSDFVEQTGVVVGWRAVLLAGDRAADHQEVGAKPNRLEWRHEARLTVRCRPRGANAGRDLALLREHRVLGERPELPRGAEDRVDAGFSCVGPVDPVHLRAGCTSVFLDAVGRIL